MTPCCNVTELPILSCISVNETFLAWKLYGNVEEMPDKRFPGRKMKFLLFLFLKISMWALTNNAVNSKDLFETVY
jgi:hypothetical protein